MEDRQFENDIEKQGYLQKKTSKGLWVNRFFKTDRNYLSYWTDLKEHDKNDPPSEKYDVAEIKIIEKVGTRGLILSFMDNTKFKIEIKTALETERNEWETILEAKRKLYSVKELLKEIHMDRLSFKTKLFGRLMILTEREQNMWILDHIDEAFHTLSEDNRIDQLRRDPSLLLKTSCRALDEFAEVCDDCELELTSKEPKINAHVRNFIRRYSDIIKGRITLELAYIPAMNRKCWDELGEKALCVALEFANKMQNLSKYYFVSNEIIESLNRNLFSSGEIISSLMNLAIRRVDAFFDEVESKVRENIKTKFMFDPQKFLIEYISLVREELITNQLFRLVVDKGMTTQLLSFVDHFMMIDFTGFDEIYLIEHIITCDQIVSSLEHFFVNLNTKQVEYGDRNNFLGNSNVLFISPAVLDAISSVCYQSARIALQKIISAACETRKHLLSGFLKESTEGWIGGILCNALVTGINHWLEYIQERLPEKFSRIVFADTCHYLVKLYIQNMIEYFKHHKNLILTSSGIKQIKEDLQIILTWVNKVTKEEEALPIKEFVKVSQNFLECSDVDALQFYAKSILIFGSKYELHLYDLFRMLLKYRSNISPKTRKAILALCGEFSAQLKRTTTVDPRLLAGSYNDVMIFDSLFETVGFEHCTGSKWKIEKPADPEAIRLSVTLMISETCNNAISKRRQSSILLSNQQDSFRSSTLLSSQSQSISGLFPPCDDGVNTSLSKDNSISSISDSSPISASTTPQSITLKKKPLPPIPMKKSLSSSFSNSPIQTKMEVENSNQITDSLGKDCFLKVSTVLQESIKEDNSPTKPLIVNDSLLKATESNCISKDNLPNLVQKESAEIPISSINLPKRQQPPPPPPPPPRRATIFTLPSQDEPKPVLKENIISDETPESKKFNESSETPPFPDKSEITNKASLVENKPPPPPPKPNRRASAPILGSSVQKPPNLTSTPLSQEDALALLLEKSKANLTF